MIGFKDNFSGRLQLLLGNDNFHFMNQWWPLLTKMNGADVPDGFEAKIQVDKSNLSKNKVVKSIISAKNQPGLLKVDIKEKGKALAKLYSIEKDPKMQRGIYFADSEFPTKLIELLKQKLKLDQFDAEFAIYMTDFKRQGKTYNVKEIYQFCQTEVKQNKAKDYDFNYG